MFTYRKKQQDTIHTKTLQASYLPKTHSSNDTVVALFMRKDNVETFPSSQHSLSWRMTKDTNHSGNCWSRFLSILRSTLTSSISNFRFLPALHQQFCPSLSNICFHGQLCLAGRLHIVYQVRTTPLSVRLWLHFPPCQGFNLPLRYLSAHCVRLRAWVNIQEVEKGRV